MPSVGELSRSLRSPASLPFLARESPIAHKAVFAFADGCVASGVGRYRCIRPLAAMLRKKATTVLDKPGDPDDAGVFIVDHHPYRNSRDSLSRDGIDGHGLVSGSGKAADHDDGAGGQPVFQVVRYEPKDFRQAAGRPRWLTLGASRSERPLYCPTRCRRPWPTIRAMSLQARRMPIGYTVLG